MEAFLKHNFTIPVPIEVKVIRTKVDKDTCESILAFAEQHKEENVLDNLYDVERTDWKLHAKEGAEEILQPVLNKVVSCSSDIVCPSYFEANTPKHEIKLNFYDTWVAWFNKESATLPHLHLPFLTHYSFSLYLKLPSGKSSIGFNQCSNRRLVDVYEGDLVIFPGFLPHWSFDMSDGRVLLAGNFEVQQITQKSNA